ncbi:hypothetical protein ASPSYDRAFT_85365 [Aspergillus sydowii CBS 593.65]|uniref:Lysine-specific metallo-endopeptidase domain-containing protein n=1 Tax=Aspergillus sydowii CBS 593.65 TaxID=1036612 RepID=A0A1L9U163_9EURO|nr:uncharacterized protein ASPSYDRAFT_85365 [Aspergillus sydowii CBS 593.65]OJJ65392.1 hypothetical protein ASPSYDRAFT_85365 [Aspergillus sydowii CBS 593.65]
MPTNGEKRDDDSYDKIYEAAEEKYPGVWWHSARRTCSEEQFTAIYEATSSAIGLINGMLEGVYLDEDVGLSPAWNKFFMDGKIWQAQYPEEFSSMLGLYDQTKFFIENGRTEKKNKAKRQHRLAYVCGDETMYNTCKEKPKTKAYVPRLPTKMENCERCFSVAFCDPFFESKPVVEIVDGAHWQEKDLNDPRLVSREHSLFHEWMHVDLMGQDWHITDLKDRDVKGDGFKHSVYGADLCSDYAWKYAAEGKVNYEIRENADNYAWVLSYTYYNAAFGWGI